VKDGFKILFSGGKQAMKDMTKDRKRGGPKSGTGKNRKAYRFTLDSRHHSGLIEFLEAVPKTLRGGYCIEALKLLQERMSMASAKEEKPRNGSSAAVAFKKSI